MLALRDVDDTPETLLELCAAGRSAEVGQVFKWLRRASSRAGAGRRVERGRAVWPCRRHACITRRPAAPVAASRIVDNTDSDEQENGQAQGEGGTLIPGIFRATGGVGRILRRR